MEELCIRGNIPYAAEILSEQMKTESYCPQAYLLIFVHMYAEEANILLVPKK